MTSNKLPTDAARFIQWNDGTIDARNGVAERSKDVDYIAGYRYGQHTTHPSFVDVGTISEYGLTQKLSTPVRCF